MTTQTVQKADRRKTSHLLKKHLKQTFGIDVKIKSDVFSMGSSLDVYYSLGVDQKEVASVVDNLQHSRFDGMTDCSYSVDNAGLVVDGYQLEEFKHVFVHQEFSEDFKFKLAKCISDNINLRDVPKLETKEQMHEYLKDNTDWGNDWSNILHRLFRVRNFVTQDESKINLVSCAFNDDHQTIYFIYEVEGKQYNTEVLEVATTQAPESRNFEKVEVKAGEVNIIDYSERAIAVVGDTRPIKDKLKSLGGKFNFRLSCGPGWIFPKSKLEELQNAFSS